VHNPEPKTTNELSKGSATKLFSRDLNYLRDVILVWPFIIFSIIAVASLLSPNARQIGLRCAILAGMAILLAKERLVILWGSGILRDSKCSVAVHTSLELVYARHHGLHGNSFLLANRYLRNPKLAYELPTEFRLIDALVSVASICGTVSLFYLLRPHS